MTDEVVNPLYDNLYRDVKKFYNDTLNSKLSAANATTLLRYAMEIIERGGKWGNMRGSEKKQLVLNVVNELVNDALADSKLSKESQRAIKYAMKMAPYIIDATVDFAKVYNESHSQGKRFICC